VVTEPLRVLVADSAPTRYGVRLALEGVAEICAEVGDRSGAIRSAVAEKPDLCLIGASLPGGGVEAARQICKALPDTLLVMLADTDGVEGLLAALRAGAIGYLPVGFDASQLRRAIAAVVSEQAAIPRAMVKELVDEIRAAERAAENDLTIRETQVLTLLRRGTSTARIAENLSISPVTVRRHISVLVRKAGVSGRDELLASLR
jgi:two-component system nitrate/nitrite response regulator NarL